MVITICGSMSFEKEMLVVAQQLSNRGHDALLPNTGSRQGQNEGELIREHYKRICQSNAILVLNLDKNGVEGWIGANTFWEMGFAYVLDKRIFLWKEAPGFSYFANELGAIEFTVIRGDVSKIH